MVNKKLFIWVFVLVLCSFGVFGYNNVTIQSNFTVEVVSNNFVRTDADETFRVGTNNFGTLTYRSAIFFADAEQQKEAEAFIALVNKSGRWNGPVVTALEHLTTFWPAEPDHQDYLQKTPGGYTCHFIRFGSYLT